MYYIEFFIKTILGDFMSIITCASDCEYQKEGYCTLNSTSQITDIYGECPYIVKPLSDKFEGFTDVSYRD